MAAIDIMIDIETLDNKAGAVITQIGAASFDRHTGEVLAIFFVNIDAASCEKLGMTIGAETVMWWMHSKRSQKARDSLINPQPEPVVQALKKFNTWVAERRHVLTDTVLLWCHASFDFPILNRALEICGITPMWGHTQYRDIRTVTDLSGINPNDFKMDDGDAHNAMADTINQVKYTCVAIQIIQTALANPVAYSDHSIFELT